MKEVRVLNILGFIASRVWRLTGILTFLVLNNCAFDVSVEDLEPKSELPFLSIADVTLTEGETGVYTISISHPSKKAVLMYYSSINQSAVATTDYQNFSGIFTIPPGDTIGYLAIDTNDDLVYEGAEYFEIEFSSVTNAIVESATVRKTVNVLDDENRPKIYVTDTSVVEGGSLEFTVSIDVQSKQDISVDFATIAGTAIGNTDYTALTGRITIAALSWSTTVVVDSLSDVLNEADETFTLTLSGLTNADPGDMSATGTIQDDDAPPVLFIGDLSIDEGTTGQLVVSLSAISGQDVVFNFATIDVTTTAPDDYGAVTLTSVTLTPGTTTYAIDLVTVEDYLSEADETFTLTLTGVQNAVAGPWGAVATIIDDDAAPDIYITDVNVIEGGTLAFTVSITELSGLPVTFNFTSFDQTALVGDLDYIAVSGTGTVAPGDYFTTVYVITTDDTKFEVDETILVSLSSVANASVITVGTDDLGVGTIQNDDVVPVLSVSDLSMTEGTTGTFVATLSAVSGVDVVFTWATADGANGTATLNAVTPADYVAVNATVVTIPAGSYYANLPVITTDDAIDESNEEFALNVTAVTGATPASLSAVGTINDNETPPNLVIDDISIGEGGTGHFTASISAISGLDVIFNWATSNNTAISGNDYNAITTTTVTIPAGSLTAALVVETLQDLLNEGSETFYGNLSAAVNANTLDNQGVATIVDDDGPPQILIGDASITEGGTLQFLITLTEVSGLDVSFDLVTTNNSATTADADYTGVSTTRVTIPAGSISYVQNVVSLQDVLDEDDETFYVDLSNATNGVLLDSQGLGTILDEDATPDLFITDNAVTEGGTLVFTVSISALSGRDVTFSRATSNGTAITAGDYVALTAATLTIAKGSLSLTISVVTNDDVLYENSEAMSLDLSAVVNANAVDSQGVGTINDNDSPPHIYIVDHSVTEGETLQFVVSIDVLSEVDVVFDATSFDGTALISNSDYTALTLTSITIPVGSLSLSLPLVSTDDLFNEPDETLTVSLSNVAGATVVAAGTDDLATGTITNDDGVPQLFVSDATAVTEGGTTTFTVSLDAASGQDVVFTYTTTDDTAVDTQDFVAKTATLTIPTGQLTVTVDVVTNDDARDEVATEYYHLDISAPTNAIIADAQGDADINDNDSPPEIFIVDSSVTEGGTMIFTVSISVLSDLDVSFDYDSFDGTSTDKAEQPGDYTALNSAAQITAGSLTLALSVVTIQDLIDEVDELFSVSLSNVVNATVATAGVEDLAVGTITDDDPTPTLAIYNVTITEGETAQVIVSLSNPSSREVVFEWSTSDNTALQPSDYTQVTTTVVTMAAMAMTSTLSVVSTENTTNEPTENFYIDLANPVNASGTPQGTVTINDDDSAPSLFIVDATAVEGETLQFTVSLSEASGYDVTFDYQSFNGTALTGDSDYTAVNLSGTIPAGSLSIFVQVITTQDTRYENDETLAVSLSNPANAIIAAAGTDDLATGTITNDDSAPGLFITDQTVTEGGTLVFTISIDAVSGLATTVEWSTADNTATIAGSDYSQVTTTLVTIPAGQLTIAVQVVSTDDTLYENTETFYANLANPTNAAIVDGQGTGTITNDDIPPTILIYDLAINEGDTGDFVVSLSAVSGLEVVFSWETFNDTAGGADFTAVTVTTVTIPALQISTVVPVITTEDLIDESDETFLVSLSSVTGATVTTAGSDDLATGTITDDDGAPQLFASDAAAVTEGDTSAFVVSLSAASGLDVVFSFATSDGTAVDTQDYNDFTGTLTIPAGQMSITIPVVTNDDNRDETSNEDYHLDISAPTNATIADAQGDGDITDNDNPPQIFIVDSTVGEGGTIYFAVSISELSDLNVTFDYDSFDGTASDKAIQPDDYGAVNTSAQINAGSLTLALAVISAQDVLDEVDEVFSVSLSSVVNATVATAGVEDLAVGTITDDDAPPTIEVYDLTVLEGETAQFAVSLSAISSLDVVFVWETFVDTAGAGDFTGVSVTTVTIPASQTSAQLTVVSTEDLLDEVDETFFVSLSSVVNATVTTAGTEDLAVGTITDDDGAPVLFAADATAVTEGGTTAFTVSISAASGQDVVFNYATSDDSAVDTQDYSNTSGTATILAGQLFVIVNAVTTDDNRDETPTEYYHLDISGPVNATIGDAQGDAGINDNDSPPQIFIVDASIGEGGTMFFAVSISEVSDLDVTFDYDSFDGSASDKAEQPGDYTALNSSAQINAGSLTLALSLITIQDVIDEVDEVLSVSLSSIVNATVATPGVEDLAVGTITDDDATPTLAIYDLTINEGETAQVVVSLSHPSSREVVFEWLTQDNTATQPSDYTQVTTTVVTMAPLALTINVNVVSVENTTNEPTETLHVDIANPVNATGTPQNTITINDDDALPKLFITGVTVTEGDTLQFIVSLSETSGYDVTFDYDSFNGTATTADSDYTALNLSGTIPLGSLSILVNLVSTQDTRYENNETVIVSLSNPTNATIAVAGTDDKATGTINNDDVPPVIFISDATVNEGGTLQFNVSISEVSGLNVGFNYATADGTATTANSDYTSLNTTGNIPAGSLSMTISVVTTQDNVYEFDETLLVTLTALTNVTAGDTGGDGTIVNEDTESDLIVYDAVATEGSNLIFTASLTATMGTDVTFEWVTLASTALDPADYTGITTTLVTIPAGQLTLALIVPSIDDIIDEPVETFNVSLANVTIANLVDDLGLGTINDNDNTAQVFIADVSVTEGASAEFVITLDRPSAYTITFNWQTVDGTAIAPGDYTTVGATAFTFAAGVTISSVWVTTNDDTTDEPTQNFTVTLTALSNVTSGDTSGDGTLTDNDAPPTIWVSDASVTEGLTMVFAVTLSAISDWNIVYDFATANGTAIGSDYAGSTGTTTIMAGAISIFQAVVTTHDFFDESDEDLTISLSNLVNVTAGDDLATGTITDNDTYPNLVVFDVTVEEGHTANVILSLSATSPLYVLVDFTTYSNTAIGGTDYTSVTSTVSIPAGYGTFTVPVVTTEEVLVELDETFNVTISSVQYAYITDDTAIVTVTNDDSIPTFTITGVTGGTDAVVDDWLTNGDKATINWANTTGESGYDVTVYETDGTTVKCATVTKAADSTNHDFSSCALTEAANYKAEVKANHAPSGSTAASNSLYSFTVDTIPPDVFTISGVTGGADSNVDVWLMANTTPVFNFENTNGESAYLVTVFQNDGTTVHCAEQTAAANSTTHTMTGCTLTDGSSYKLRVIARDLANNRTTATNSLFAFGADWSAPGAFSITGATGGTDVTADHMLTDGILATINWTNASGEDGYEVTVFENDGTTVKCAMETKATNITNHDFSACSLTLGTTYKATVVAFDLAGNRTNATNNSFAFTLVPSIHVDDLTLAEDIGSGVAAVMVTLSFAVDQAVTFNWTTVADTATASGGTQDYTTTTSIGTLAAGATGITITVPLINDPRDEPDQSFAVSITAHTYSKVGDKVGLVTIQDEDPEPNIFIGDISLTEGQSAAFTVSITEFSEKTITTAFATSNGTGSTPTDYGGGSGTLTVPQMTKSVILQRTTVDNSIPCQAIRTFTMTLSSLTNALTGDLSAICQIDENDSPAPYFNSVTVTEGSVANITASLAVACERNVYYNWRVVSNTAIVTRDFPDQTGAVTIAANTLQSSFNVQTTNDTEVEVEENFFVSAVATAGVTIGTQSVGAINLVDNDVGLGVARVSGENVHSCAVLTDGRVKCWGQGDMRLGRPWHVGDEPGEMGDKLVQLDMGTGRSVVEVTSGTQFHCARLDNGTVKCWGTQSGTYKNGPTVGTRNLGASELGDALPIISFGTGLTAKKISNGDYFTCAILNNDKVKCWGNNNAGRLGQGDTNHRGSVIEMGSNLIYSDLGTGHTAKNIVTGVSHTCVVLNDDRLKCWGANNFGQLGLGDTQSRGDNTGEMGDSLPYVDLGSGRTVKKIAAHGNGNCVILDNDVLKCWGYNASGQLGRGITSVIGDGAGEMGAALATVSLGTGRTAVNIAGGSDHMCALLDNGSVKCWGYNGTGALGLGDSAHRGDAANEMHDSLPAVNLGTGKTATAIAAINQFSCAILNDGTMKCWGRNEWGYLGVGQSVHLGDGGGEMGDALPTVSLGTGRSAKTLFTGAGADAICVVMDNDQIKCWGFDNIHGVTNPGQPSVGDIAADMGDNLPTLSLYGAKAVDVGVGDIDGCFLTNQGEVRCWGQAGDEIGSAASIGDNVGEAAITIPMGTGRKVLKLSVGDHHRCAILDNFKAKCWGNGGNGRLGYGNTTSFGNPITEVGDALPYVDVGTNLAVLDIEAGQNWTCALLNNFRVKCWGHNNYGQLGLGHTNALGDGPGEMGDLLAFVDLGAGRTAKDIWTGEGNSCALLDDNTIKCWGRGDLGTLGMGTGSTNHWGDGAGEMGSVSHLTVSLGTGATPIAFPATNSQAWHSCALLADGRAKCWGYNNTGQLGLGYISARGFTNSMGDLLPYPDLGTGLTQVSHVGLGGDHTCMILTDGRMKCFGYNLYGMLGKGRSNLGDGPGEMGDNLHFVELFGTPTGTPASFNITGLTGGGDAVTDAMLGNANPTVHWQAASGATSYAVTIYNTNLTVACATQNTAGTSYTFGCSLSDGVTYLARVVATDGSNNTTALNADFSFVVDLTAPSAFNITGVTGGADTTADATLADGLYATINWEAAQGGATSYAVTVFENDGVTTKCGPANLGPGAYEYNFSACALTAGQSYKAKVSTADVSGNSRDASNSLYAFTVTDSSAAGAFTITGATGASDFLADNSLTSGTWVTANWTNASGEDSYDVTIYENDGTTVKCATINLPADTTNYNFASCNLTVSSTYKIAVVAKDVLGNVNAANNMFDFTVNSLGPSSFEITGVRGGADVTLDAFLTDGLISTIEWTAATGAATYTVAIYESDMVTIKCPLTTTTAALITLSSCTLNPQTTYKILLFATDTSGNITPSNNSGFAFSLPAKPILYIDKTYGVEGGNLVFTASLSASYPVAITANYGLFDNSAKGDIDFDSSAVSGQIVFDPGITQSYAVVPILDDTLSEVEETIILNITLATNAQIGRQSAGVGYINDNDTTLGVAKAISGSGATNCGLLSDGRVRCFGDGYLGRNGAGGFWKGDRLSEMGDALPAINWGTGLSATQLMNGVDFTCAIFGDGRSKCFGENAQHQLLSGDTISRGHIPSTLGDALIYQNFGLGRTVQQISLGYRGGCALLDNNKVKCWGENTNGKLGRGITTGSYYIGGGGWLNADFNPYIDLGTGRTALEVSHGNTFVCVRLDNNQVKCWGYNGGGGLGLGDTLNRGDNPNEMGDNLPTVSLGTGRSATKLATGGGYTCALLDNGSVKCWGDEASITDPGNGAGNAPNEMGDNLAPVNFGAGRTAVDLVAGYRHACAKLDNGVFKCWGENNSGELGRGHNVDSLVVDDTIPGIDLGSSFTIAEISPYYDATCARSTMGAVKCWGYNTYAQLGIGDSRNRGVLPDEMGDNLPAVNLGTGRTAVALSKGTATRQACALLDNGQTKCWGYSVNAYEIGYGERYIGDAPGEAGDNVPVVSLGTNRKAKYLAGADGYYCAILDDNSIRCWGEASGGRLPFGSMAYNDYTTGDNIPTITMPAGKIPIKINLASIHVCVLFDDLTGVCWGDSSSGRRATGGTTTQIGFGDALLLDLFQPGTASGMPLGVIDIRLGDNHTCLHLTDKTIKCYGTGNNGRLGYGSTNHMGDTSNENGNGVPAVDLGTGVLISKNMGGQQAGNCAVLDNGSVKCWGYGQTYGGHGLGSTNDIGDNANEMGDLLPAVSIGTGVKALRLNEGFVNTGVCVITTDYRAKCWARGDINGAHGNSNTWSYGYTPTTMGDYLPFLNLGVTNAKLLEIHSTWSGSCALFDNGKAKCWGDNSGARLAIGSTAHIGDGIGEMGEYLPYMPYFDSDISPGTFLVGGITGSGDAVQDQWLGHNIATVHWGASPGATQYQVTILNSDNTVKCATQTTASTSYTFSGCTLTHNTIYRARVVAVDGSSLTREANNSPYSFLVDTQAPAAFTISGVKGGLDVTADATLADGRLVTVVWSQSAGAHSYDITVYENDGTTVKCATVARPASPLYYEFSGCQLTNGTSYKARVVAKDLMGNQQVATNSLYTFTVTEGTAPVNFNITGATGGLDVTADGALTNGTWVVANWADTTGEDSYDVTIYENDGTTVKCATQNVPRDTTSYSFASCALTQGTTYKMVVAAKDTGATVAAANSPFDFTVSSTGPQTFSILGVLGGTDVTADNMLVENFTPTVSLSASTGATVYKATILSADGVTTVCSQQSSATRSIAFPSSCALTSGNYYRVQAIAEDAVPRTTPPSNNLYLFSLPLYPAVTLLPVTVSEGNNAVVTVTLSNTYSSPVVVNWRTIENTARRSFDYTEATGSVTIAAGNVSGTLTIATTEDSNPEVEERFIVVPYSVTNAQSGTSSPAMVTLQDDDAGVGVVKVANNNANTCALFSDGRVKCWGLSAANVSGFGANGEGRALGGNKHRGDEPNEMGDNLPFIDIGTGFNISDIQSGKYHSCALTSLGQVKCWTGYSGGYTGMGSTWAIGDTESEMGDSLPYVDLGAGLTVAQIATTYALSTCARFTTGQVKCWGYNNWGQLGLGHTNTIGDGAGEMGAALPFVNLGTGLTATYIQGGYGHVCALLNNNQVKCWGRNLEGQSGIGLNTNRGDAANEMGDFLPIVSLGTGRTVSKLNVAGVHNCAILDDGTMKCWGAGGNYQLNNSSTNNIGDGAGEMHDALMTVSIGVGETFSNFWPYHRGQCIITGSNLLKCFGSSYYGEVGYDYINGSSGFSPQGDNHGTVFLGNGRTVVSGAASNYSNCALLDNGQVKCWGLNTWGMLGYGHTNNLGDAAGEMSSLAPLSLGTGLTVSKLTGGQGDTLCAIFTNGKAKCWGDNSFATLGYGSMYVGDDSIDMGANLPTVSLGTGRTAKDISMGVNYACALLDNDQAKCWGYNGYGNHGVGDTNNRGDTGNEMGDNLPAVTMGTGGNILSLTSGVNHNCALLKDFTVRCWGQNNYGQLGVGHTSTRGETQSSQSEYVNSPVDLGTNRYPVYVSASGNHSCAILDNLETKCWGRNDQGELGIGSSTHRGDAVGEMGDALPTVSLGTGRFALSLGLGANHTCAILDNGTSKCWGNGGNGEIGTGSTTDRGIAAADMGDNLPTVSLGTGRSVKNFTPATGSANASMMCAILDNNSLKCWGNNTTYGQLGLGNVNNRGDAGSEMHDFLPAVDLGTGRTALQVSHGENATCAVLDNLTLKCWGHNLLFNLGIGTNDNTPRGDAGSEMGDLLPAIDIGN